MKIVQFICVIIVISNCLPEFGSHPFIDVFMLYSTIVYPRRYYSIPNTMDRYT